MNSDNREKAGRNQNWFLIYGPALIFFCLLAAGCEGPGEQAQKVSQEALNQFKAAWKTQVEKHQHDETGELMDLFPGAEVRIIRNMLKAAPNALTKAEFQRICSTPVPEYFKIEDGNLDKLYDSVLLQAFIEDRIEKRDKKVLVSILSNNCPTYVVSTPLEFCLVRSWSGGIHCLFDSYPAAKSSETKTNIAVCLGRAFPSLRKKYSADDVFVKEAARWYSGNSGKLKVNYNYKYVPQQPGSLPGVDSDNLFVTTRF